MLKQYCILTSCLSELKASNLPAIDKLKFEIQIIKTKRILLDHDVANRVSGMASSEKAFAELYDLVRSACSSSCTVSGSDELMHHLVSIRNSLENDTVNNINNEQYRHKGFGCRIIDTVLKYKSHG